MTQRILMIAGDYPPLIGGMADYSRRLATALAAEGVEVTVLTTATDSATGEALEQGVRVLRTMRGWRLRDLPRVLEVVDGVGEGSLVHIQYPAVAFRRGPMINLLPGLLRRRRRSPVIVTVHDARVMRRRWRARLTPMLSAATAIVHVDPPDLPFLDRWTWANRPLSTCIPIGASIPPIPASAGERRAWRQALGLPGAEPVVAFLGMLYPHKGLPELVSAVELLRAHGSGVRLLVLGDFDRDTPFQREVNTLFQRGREEGWLVWLRGADHEGVSRGLWSADVAALPFHSGAASNRSSMLSALAHHLPTVTTRGPATPDGFETRFPVSLVPVGDPGTLAEALGHLLERNDGAGEAFRRRVALAVPSWEEVARQHVDLYARLVAAQGTAA